LGAPGSFRRRSLFIAGWTAVAVRGGLGRCLLLLWVRALPLTTEADPDLGEPAIFIAEIGIGHMVHGGEHVPTLRQHYSDGTRLSKIGGATEGAVVPVVKRSPGRAFQEKPPGEKHVPGKPRVKLAGIAVGTDRGANVEPRSQKVVQDAALVFWTKAVEQHLDIDIGGTAFVSRRAIDWLKHADASFVDKALRPARCPNLRETETERGKEEAVSAKSL
jgi:hypothetical protein